MKRDKAFYSAIFVSIVSIGIQSLTTSFAQAEDAATATQAAAAPTTQPSTTADAPCGSVDNPYGSSGCPAPAATPGKPRVLANDDWVIKAKMRQIQNFKLTEPHRVRVQVVGVKDTAKGFNVVTTPDEGGPGGISQSYRRDFDMAAGPHTIAVSNSQNAIKKMTVHVTIVVDPGN